jgi:hypothetical protein
MYNYYIVLLVKTNEDLFNYKLDSVSMERWQASHQADNNSKWRGVLRVGVILAIALPLALQDDTYETSMERALRLLNEYPLIDG